MSAINVNVNDVWALESPLYRAEGITETFTLRVVSGGTCSSSSAKAYKKNVDVSNTVFPSGDVTSSENVITLKPATGFVGGTPYASYVIEVQTTEGGNVHKYKFEIRIQKASAPQ